MEKQLSYLPPEPVRVVVKMTTYIYLRPDGKCVHANAGGGFIGKEYEHDDPNWQPPEDWPYEIVDLRKKAQEKGGERPCSCMTWHNKQGREPCMTLGLCRQR